jgi:hypothetical protein
MARLVQSIQLSISIFNLPAQENSMIYIHVLQRRGLAACAP